MRRSKLQMKSILFQREETLFRGYLWLFRNQYCSLIIETRFFSHCTFLPIEPLACKLFVGHGLFLFLHNFLDPSFFLISPLLLLSLSLSISLLIFHSVTVFLPVFLAISFFFYIFFYLSYTCLRVVSEHKNSVFIPLIARRASE